MKASLTFLFIAFALINFSCSEANEYEEIEKTKIAKFLKDFKNKNPLWINNSVSADSINPIFRLALFNFFKENRNALDELKFTFESIRPLKSGEYVAEFRNNDSRLGSDYPFKIKLAAIVKKDIAMSLKENQSYFLNTEFHKIALNEITFIGYDPTELPFPTYNFGGIIVSATKIRYPYEDYKNK